MHAARSGLQCVNINFGSTCTSGVAPLQQNAIIRSKQDILTILISITVHVAVFEVNSLVRSRRAWRIDRCVAPYKCIERREETSEEVH